MLCKADLVDKDHLSVLTPRYCQFPDDPGYLLAQIVQTALRHNLDLADLLAPNAEFGVQVPQLLRLDELVGKVLIEGMAPLLQRFACPKIQCLFVDKEINMHGLKFEMLFTRPSPKVRLGTNFDGTYPLFFLMPCCTSRQIFRTVLTGMPVSCEIKVNVANVLDLGVGFGRWNLIRMTAFRSSSIRASCCLNLLRGTRLLGLDVLD